MICRDPKWAPSMMRQRSSDDRGPVCAAGVTNLPASGDLAHRRLLLRQTMKSAETPD
jgi:hypothetical protein